MTVMVRGGLDRADVRQPQSPKSTGSPTLEIQYRWTVDRSSTGIRVRDTGSVEIDSAYKSFVMDRIFDHKASKKTY